MPLEQSEQTILIIDDTPSNLEILVDALGGAGFEIAVVKSGEKALALVEDVQPDLILLDVLMPGIDGFETCRRLKAQETSKAIPVIFMTALTETIDKVHGFEAGGVDYITKPFQVEEVLARVTAHVTIQRLQRQLQQEISTKDIFFSIIAHDLRNPFASILSFVELFEHIDELKKDEILLLTAELRKSAENFSVLLDNLLTWSRFQRGLLTCRIEPIPLAMLAARNVELLDPTASQKQVTLSNTIGQDLVVAVDVHMLDAVMRNLLSNAVKFTGSDGTVEISATKEQTLVTVAVSDTGVGIPEKRLDALFQLDARYQREGTCGERGTGLGLILCQEFIEKLGGTLRVESQVGKGSTFTFTLPASKSANV